MPEAKESMTSNSSIWTGRIISALLILFLLFDATIKLLKAAAAVQGTVQAGYPEAVVRPLGIVLLLCVLLYSIPSTSILGAILLTGYLGGATATMVRTSNPLFWIPVICGVLIWLGLFLQDARLRGLIPLRAPHLR